MTAPKAYHGIMVSSTFNDLALHRRDVIAAIEALGFKATVMEASGPQAEKDVIDASIQMVRDAAAYVGIISRRYGQTPECAERNPDGLSITELEFNEAMALGRPILLFIMGDAHKVLEKDIELDQIKREKLTAFRSRAKKMREGSEVHRVYRVFNSPEDFAQAATVAIGNLAPALRPPSVPDQPDRAETDNPGHDSIAEALPPELRAVPRYLGSHDFLGRAAELDTLDDWCSAADTKAMLLFEAIGGSGKSMVTWTWLKTRAATARGDWAGRFWFSFYEGGATMTRFCREALAYMTDMPPKQLRKMRMPELTPLLLTEIEARPWLIVLDGLERVLVAYHRIDAPQVRDDEIEQAGDQIAKRDPRDVINPDDEDLLRRMTAEGASKVLVTSRLRPRALLNQFGTLLPGVRHEMLGGLRPADAEELLHSCGVEGESEAIRLYLQRNCDCHPLVVGALGGLISNYAPSPGDFDAWFADPEAGGKLRLGELNLVQRQNHILDAAIAALPDAGRTLLRTLSLLQQGADYETLRAFNPHLPEPPEEVREPRDPRRRWRLDEDGVEPEAAAAFEEAQRKRAAYLDAYQTWERGPEVLGAPGRLEATLTDLQRRGLLQYERGMRRYDLHPVVRGVASDRMSEAETTRIGTRVVDHFTDRPHDPWEQAETLEDLAPGIQLVATLTRIGRFGDALAVYRDGLCDALVSNLMATEEILRLVRPFFPDGWFGAAAMRSDRDRSWLFNHAGIAISDNDPTLSRTLVEQSLQIDLSAQDRPNLVIDLGNLAKRVATDGQNAKCHHLQRLSLELAEALDEPPRVFTSLLELYGSSSVRGDKDEADALWDRLDPMGRDWPRRTYDPGRAEVFRILDYYYRKELTDTSLTDAEKISRRGRSRYNIIRCANLRGRWHLDRGEPDLAIPPLTEALRLLRLSGRRGLWSQAVLTLARLRTGQGDEAPSVARRLEEKIDRVTALSVAELLREVDEPERATAAALRAHAFACCSGEPYVHRHSLERAESLLRELGQEPPTVPQYDPASDVSFPWEDDVRVLIEETREERANERRRKSEREDGD